MCPHARVALLLTTLALAACGGASEGGSSRATSGGPTSGGAGSGGAHAAARFPGPERPWAELDHQARAHHMSRSVVPAMSELFEGYDAERFGSFGCPSCHGPDGRERHYAMPSPSLPALYPTGSIGQHRAVAQYPEGVRFMYSEVTPAMRQLLGAPEFDETTHEGFTCFSCHPHAADDDPLAQPE